MLGTVLAPAVAVLLVAFVGKPLSGRRHNGALYYPSGHTTACVAVLCVALLAAGSLPGLALAVLAGVPFVMEWRDGAAVERARVGLGRPGTP